MDKILSKLRKAVAKRGEKGPLIQDVRSATLSFSSYRWVLVAVAIAALYYMFIASDRFVTVAHVYVKSTESQAGAMPQLQLLSGAKGETQDALLLSVYAQSGDILRRVEDKVQFSEHFAGDGGDFWSRLPDDATEEERLNYFKDKLSVKVNPDSGIITFRGQGYTPEFSLAFVKEVIAASDDFVNSVGQSIAKEEIAFVEHEMERARGVLDAARTQLLNFQNENGVLSAEVSGIARQALVNEMESDLVRLRTEEKTLASYLNEGAAELTTVRNRIGALANQLVLEKEKLASIGNVSLNDVNAEYQTLEMELQFATDLYKTTIVALERARVDSYHKLKHLVVIQSPTLPDDAAYPRKLYDLFSLFIGLSLLYGIVTMILATIREHRDV